MLYVLSYQDAFWTYRLTTHDPVEIVRVLATAAHVERVVSLYETQGRFETVGQVCIPRKRRTARRTP